MIEPWVTVISNQDGDVLTVLGPSDSKTDALAVGQVVRCSRGEQWSVHRVRRQNIRDLHGEGFDD